MIKSSKLTLKYLNIGKLKLLQQLHRDYLDVVNQSIDYLFTLEGRLPTFFPSEIKLETNLSARMVQCASKQAIGIMNATREKQSRRLYIINKLHKEGKVKEANKLQEIYDRNLTKPSIKNLEMQLDTRFITLDLEGKTSFDIYLKLSSLYKRGIGPKAISIPLNKHKHFNSLASLGNLKPTVRLGLKTACFCFELEDLPKKKEGKVLGIDIGILNTCSCSDGTSTQEDSHRHTLQTILQKLSRKKKGSKAFLKAQRHRDNFIKWSVKQLNLTDVKTICLEDIKALRYKQTANRLMSHWTYTTIREAIETLASQHGVHVEVKSPIYTSQRCSCCGWTQKKNRKGKQFKCLKCGFSADADLNAATNLSLPLIKLTKSALQLKLNKEGFYFTLAGQEPIVPVSHEAE